MAAFLFWKHSQASKRDRLRNGTTGVLESQVTVSGDGEEVPYEEGSWQIEEMEEQRRATEIQALSRRGELGGNAVAELPTPESQYYMFYSALSPSSIRSTLLSSQQSHDGQSNGHKL